MDGYTVVVTKSTVPVGTGDEVEEIIKKRRPDAQFAVVSNPEFLREGAAISDFKRPDRVVVGTDDERARERMRDLYRPLFLNETPIVFTQRRTSELIKYAANAFLAMKITFINEVADLCEEVGANVQEVARGIGLDNRIGRKFLHAGPGYGGSCFPKDTLALMKTARDAKAPIELIETTVRVNSARKQKMAQKIIAALDGAVKGKTIAVLGLTFKPNTDDMRDAPALEIVPTLQAEGARVRAFDPEGMKEAKHDAERRDLRVRPLRLRPGRRRGGDHHRMGPVPRPGFRSHEGRAQGPGGDRSAQHLLARRNAGQGLHLCERRAGVKRWARCDRWRCANSPRS